MEPTLTQMSDYDRPLSTPKRRAIAIAFAIAVALGIAYAELMQALS